MVLSTSIVGVIGYITLSCIGELICRSRAGIKLPLGLRNSEPWPKLPSRGLDGAKCRVSARKPYRFIEKRRFGSLLAHKRPLNHD